MKDVDDIGSCVYMILRFFDCGSQWGKGAEYIKQNKMPLESVSEKKSFPPSK